MRTRAEKNHYMKERRALLRQEGICVDCQRRDASSPHVVCDLCRKARRDRLAASCLAVTTPEVSTAAALGRLRSKQGGI